MVNMQLLRAMYAADHSVLYSVLQGGRGQVDLAVKFYVTIPTMSDFSRGWFTGCPEVFLSLFPGDIGMVDRHWTFLEFYISVDNLNYLYYCCPPDFD